MVAETLWEDDENFQSVQSAAPDTPKSLLFLSPIVYNRLMSYGHFVLVCTLLVAESVAAPLPPPKTIPTPLKRLLFSNRSTNWFDLRTTVPELERTLQSFEYRAQLERRN
jgi:hypothetical protein